MQSYTIDFADHSITVYNFPETNPLFRITNLTHSIAKLEYLNCLGTPSKFPEKMYSVWAKDGCGKYTILLKPVHNAYLLTYVDDYKIIDNNITTVLELKRQRGWTISDKKIVLPSAGKNSSFNMHTPIFNYIGGQKKNVRMNLKCIDGTMAHLEFSNIDKQLVFATLDNGTVVDARTQFDFMLCSTENYRFKLFVQNEERDIVECGLEFKSLRGWTVNYNVCASNFVAKYAECRMTPEEMRKRIQYLLSV